MAPIRVRVRCPGVSSSPMLLETCTSETNFAEFKRKIVQLLGLDQTAEGGSTILTGFPPRPLLLLEDAAIGSVLNDNETVTVRVEDASSAGENPQGGSWGRSKRGASSTSRRGGAANSTGAKVKTKGKGKGQGGGVSPAGGIHSLSGPLASSPPARGTAGAGGSGNARAHGPREVQTLFGAANARRQPPSGPLNPGRGRLPDGRDVDQGEVAPPSRKRRRGKDVELTSEGDISERLLTAVSGGGGTVNKFFRKAMRLAVDKQYDQSKADARVRAALGGWFKAEESAGQRRLGTGEVMAMHVTFSKGPGAKSCFEEEVEFIPRAQVAAVVRMVAADMESREMLKPHNMAGCSPRIFWSVVKHWGGDVPRALELAVPDADWSFLHVRERTLSQKALQNAEQQAEAGKEKEKRRKGKEEDEEQRRQTNRDGVCESPTKNADKSKTIAGGRDGSSSSFRETGTADKTTQVEECATEELEDVGVQGGAGGGEPTKNAREQAAKAALERLRASQLPPEGAPAGGVTETEDLEALSEIVGEGNLEFLVSVGLRTPGQLADRDEEVLAIELRRHGAGVKKEEVVRWVELARGEELDKMMEDLVGGAEMMEALEVAKISTPRDLVRLARIPDVFVGALRAALGPEAFQAVADKVSAEEVVQWRGKAQKLLSERPWLELWVHE
ncbi:unnamed protein product [Discosporangium mesarthrocarpum]